MNELLKSQSDALAYIRSNALSRQEAALDRAEKIMIDEGLSMLIYSKTLKAIKANAPIDVSFHPDRPDSSGKSVVASLLESAIYKSQYETGISNGGLTAFKGGNRDLWEKHLFGGAYHDRNVKERERPKYGALNLMNYQYGASPRFGSCFFRLKPAVAARCSFSYGDSSSNPSDTAVIDCFESVLTELITDVSHTGSALGSDTLKLSEILQDFINQDHARKLNEGSPGISPGIPERSLDNYIEVHIHGLLNLATDVEWLAADDSFFNTVYGDHLAELAEHYGFSIVWNPAIELATDQVPADFRGPIMVPLARHIASDGILNAAKIGQAVRNLHDNPKDWLAWGTKDQTLQYLKQIWHVLVAYGHIKQFSHAQKQ